MPQNSPNAASGRLAERLRSVHARPLAFQVSAPSPPLAAASIAAASIAALSGRVVEHALGYRAERAVVRELRLGVATHLAVRSLKQLRQLMDALEERYQVSVDVGQQEREIADRMRTHGTLEPSKVPFVWDRNPWRLI